MNIKQVVKFILLSIVISFLFSAVVGVLEAFLVDAKVVITPAMNLLKDIVVLLLVIPATSIAASVVYKRQPTSKQSVGKIALVNTLTALVLSCIVLFSSQVETKTIVFGVISLVLTYAVTVYFVKKYSVE